MAAGNFTLYNSAKRKLQTADIDLNAGIFKARLYKGQAAASVSAAHAISTIAGLGTTNACANCSDKALAAFSVAALTSANGLTQRFTSTDLVFTATGGNIASAQYMVIWESAGGELLGWVKLSTAAFSVTSGNTLTVYAPTNGWFVTY